jgi:hypothetical protein
LGIILSCDVIEVLRYVEVSTDDETECVESFEERFHRLLVNLIGMGYVIYGVQRSAPTRKEVLADKLLVVALCVFVIDIGGRKEPS